MTSYRLKETRCPWCEYRIDGATDLADERGPEPGDLSICIACASLLKFDQDLTPQKVSEDERRQIMKDDPELAEIADHLQSITRSINRRG
jgi:hypothetical protein